MLTKRKGIWKRERWTIGPLLVFSLLLIGLPARGEPAAPEPVKSGEQLYREACGSCHGSDGRGASQSRLGFDQPMPDFTDCSFATREPDGDWIAVSHEGGPARAFSRLMPAFGGALSEEEIALATAHVRTFCRNDAWPRGDLNLPRAMITEKAFPEDEAVYTVEFPLEGEGAFSNEIVYEKRLGARHQLEFVVPFGWEERSPAGSEPGSWTGGVGDMALGAKSAIWHSFEKGSIFSVAGEIILPTGSEEKGMGKGTAVFEPFVSFGQILPSNFFLHAQGGLELPFDTEIAGQEGFWRLALGRTFTEGRFGRAWSPMLEVLAGRELESAAEADWDLLPQLQFTLNTRQNIMMNVGVRIPVTDAGHRDTQILVYFLWDWFDGGLLEGW